MHKLFCLILLLTNNVYAVGRFVNPLTDICWSCLFPISIGSIKVNSQGLNDTDNPSTIPCFCPRAPSPIPLPGIPIGFWEPARLVDITRTPLLLVAMGGIRLGNMQQHGTHSSSYDPKRGKEHSFYHVHWYIYPVLYWLEILMDFLCLEPGSPDVAFLSEFDPTWDDDEAALILAPETMLFANPIAQAACSLDCLAASTGLANDLMFWCGGCQGSIYPLTGNVEAHTGGVQASLLLAQRMAAKLHRLGVAWGTCGKEALCKKYIMPVIKKKQYKTQMIYPIPATNKTVACHPMGRSEVALQAGREFPWKGEDFAYLVWRKRNCCVL